MPLVTPLVNSGGSGRLRSVTLQPILLHTTHNLEVYPSLPEPFVRQDSEFHFLRSGQLLNVALETGVYCVGCKLCFVPKCLRYESRIDLSEVMVSG